MPTPLMTSPANEPELESLARPYVETIMGQPRVSQAIQFLPPGIVLSTRRERSPEVAKHTDSETLSMPVPFAAMPPEMQAMPSAIPTTQILSEKVGISGYSPFERRFEQRVFKTHQDSEWDENFSSNGIPVPPLLLRELNAGTQAGAINPDETGAQ